VSHTCIVPERAGRLEQIGKKPVADKVSEKKKRARGTSALGPNAEIGRKLKQYYESLVAEEVPDRFAQLLSQLENVETRKLGKD
jgi:hypothetical protein